MEIIKILLFLSLHNIICYIIATNPEVDLLAKFRQHGFKVKFERLDLQYYDKETFKYVHVVTFKYNRSTAVSNISLETKIDYHEYNLTVIVQIYKFLSNEYRHFPIRYQVNFCKAVNADMIGLLQITTLGNFPTTCALKKGVRYYTNNFAPEEGKFPPLIPNGDFKMEFNLYNENNLIPILNGLAKVHRPM